MATAHEILIKAVQDAKAELEKYEKSLFDWRNAPEYLKAKAASPKTAADNAQIAASEKIIKERAAQVEDLKIKLDQAIKRLQDYETNSPVVQSTLKSAEASAALSADTRRTLWIVGGILGLGLLFWAIISKVKSSQPQTT